MSISITEKNLLPVRRDKQIGLTSIVGGGGVSSMVGVGSAETGASILAKLLTVDGAGSLLDADLLDGAEGALYARLASPTFTGTVTTPTINITAQAQDISLNNYRITNLADPVIPTDAVNLVTLLNTYGITLNYWLQASNELGQMYAASVAERTEVVNAIPDTLSNIYYKSTVISTPTPFLIKNGAELLTHFQAKVDSTVAGKTVTLITQLFYVDADGTSNPVQIGTNSIATGNLTTSKVLYENYISVATETIVPAGKRLWLKFIATPSTLTGYTPTVSVWDGDVHDHLSIPVSGSILGRYLQLSGGTMIGLLTVPSLIVTDLTDGYVPYRVAATDKLGNSPVFSDGTNIGIGTTDPLAPLHVNSTSNYTDIYLQNQSAGGITWGIVSMGNIAGRVGHFEIGRPGISIDFTIDEIGNVGIGTTSGLSKLSINGGLHVGGDSDAGDNNLLVDGYIRSSVTPYVSQTTGWNISQEGAGDFRYLYADELHAKSFIADLEQALAGGQIISKSVAPLAAIFTVPAAEATATMVVESFKGFDSAKVFVDGDIVRVRQFDRTGTSLNITNCWGTVVWVSTDTTNKTQTYTFTRSAAPNAGAATATSTVGIGTLVLDYGTTGNGFLESTAIDGAMAENAPYHQIVSWTTHPNSGLSVKTRLGNLKGITSVSNEYGLIAGNGFGDANQYFRISNTAIEIHNVPFKMYDGAVNTFLIDPTAPSLAMGSTLPTAYMTGNGIWMGKDTVYKMRVGSVAAGALTEGFSWDGTNFAIKGSVTATSGLIGGFTITANELYAGSGATRVEMQAAGGFWAGADAFADAQFSVSPAGAMRSLGVVEFGTAASNSKGTGNSTNIAIKGSDLWENAFNGDGSYLYLNYYGYNGGISKFRNLFIGDGKGAPCIQVIGSTKKVTMLDLEVDINLSATNIRSDKYIYAYTGVSDTIILSHNAEDTTTSDVYVKLKTITLGANVEANRTLRIQFDLRRSVAGPPYVYGKIYRNGSAVGTERTTASETYVTYSEDIAGWGAGNTIELWVKADTDTAYIMNFRVCGTLATIVNEITGTNS